MKRILLYTALVLVCGAGLVFAQLPVFDASVFAQALLEVSKLTAQYNELVPETYQMITNQYNQMLWMAKELPDNLAHFRAIQTPWFLSAATNTYGTTGGWIGAINTGTNIPFGYQSATEQLMPYGAALAFVPADQLDRLEKHYATIELTDGANQDGMETIGTLTEAMRRRLSPPFNTSKTIRSIPIPTSTRKSRFLKRSTPPMSSRCATARTRINS